MGSVRGIYRGYKHVLMSTNNNTRNVYKSYAYLQILLEQRAVNAGFKSEVTKSQELHLASVTKDTDRLQGQIDKIKAEIRYVRPYGVGQ